MEEKRRLPNVRGSGHSLFRRSRKEDRIYFKWARVFLQLGSSDNILGVSVRREGEGVDSETSNQIRKQCPYTNGQKPVCNDSKFRNIDGSCNQKVNKPKKWLTVAILLKWQDCSVVETLLDNAVIPNWR